MDFFRQIITIAINNDKLSFIAEANYRDVQKQGI